MAEPSENQAVNQGQGRVVVVGAGPVGLVLAMDLAARGIATVVLEQRGVEDPAHPKCNTTSARTMEILRRLGCAEAYRESGLPTDFPNDVVYATQAAAGHVLARLALPSSGDRWAGDRFAFDGGWPSAERPHRASQMYLEQVLRRHAASFELIDLRFEHAVEGVSQDADGVRLEVRDLVSGEASTWTAPYVVGCDGGRSTVRRALDVKMVGAAAAQANIWAIFMRCPELLARCPQPPAWMTWVNGPKARGMLCAIDGRETWLAHCTLPPGVEHDDFDWRRGVQDLLGFEAEFELLAAEKWRLTRAVAERYRVGRVFLAGDAAHAWPPFAGFGMNSGIEDAIGLGWMLAAVVKGWAGEGLLDAYEAERKAVGELVSHAAESMVLAQRAITNDPLHRGNLELDGPDGEISRAYVGRKLLEVDSQQFNPVGLNFGVPYEGSPAIAYDRGAPPPAFAVGRYEPSTAPGCRAPYFVLANGRGLHDLLGDGFALLRSDPDIDVGPLMDAASARGAPLRLLDIGHEPKAAELYDTPLVLVRPDQRIAWRGARAPTAPERLLETLIGAPPPHAVAPNTAEEDQCL